MTALKQPSMSSLSADMSSHMQLEETDPDWSTYKIAIVDDNMINQKILCKMLRKYLGITIPACDIYDNGKELVDALAARTYDLILLDIEMPLMDGMVTATVIRSGLPSPASDIDSDSGTPFEPSHTYPPSPVISETFYEAVLPENRDVPIVAVTCNAQDHQILHYNSIGINSTVGKPVDPTMLIPIIKHYLQWCRTPGTAQRGEDLPRSHSSNSFYDSDDGRTVSANSSDSSSRLLRIFDSVLHSSGMQRKGTNCEVRTPTPEPPSSYD
ncbi:CheY-like superfamily [Powellomyces hirtus]|nr:CheY-like superfamily [Powellomyces hirtus]